MAVRRRTIVLGEVGAVVLSLLPADYVRRSNLSPHAEHVLAYAVTASFFFLGRRGVRMIGVLVGLLSYTAGLEYLQRFLGGHVVGPSERSTA